MTDGPTSPPSPPTPPTPDRQTQILLALQEQTALLRAMLAVMAVPGDRRAGLAGAFVPVALPGLTQAPPLTAVEPPPPPVATPAPPSGAAPRTPATERQVSVRPRPSTHQQASPLPASR